MHPTPSPAAACAPQDGPGAPAPWLTVTVTAALALAALAGCASGSDATTPDADGGATATSAAPTPSDDASAEQAEPTPSEEPAPVDAGEPTEPGSTLRFGEYATVTDGDATMVVTITDVREHPAQRLTEVFGQQSKGLPGYTVYGTMRVVADPEADDTGVSYAFSTSAVRLDNTAGVIMSSGALDEECSRSPRLEIGEEVPFCVEAIADGEGSVLWADSLAGYSALQGTAITWTR
ncbi:hypothetical protein [Xylanimonas ulmi]|uniref:Uncharacterized protein n=1 Tax=Xylanimonas ulmi TaxID=228973 RepID=A0A4V2EY69_9MICO|nr:hypothetical protein [Xylanibacterium ulmi]RZS61950.1 hypothetical protein EV386_2266 [Xylanibacterium ulmi]